MRYIRTIDTNQDIPSGSIIIFNSQPETKWIIQWGAYVYAGQPAEGWNARALPSGAVLPIDPAEFGGVTLISGGVNPPCPPPPPPGPGPHPPCPPPPPYPYWNEAPNMITVDSVEDRDRIAHRLLVDGKIVRVNNYNGRPEYFEWDEESHTWKIADFGPHVASVTYVENNYFTKEQTEVVIEDAFEWHKIGQ